MRKRIYSMGFLIILVIVLFYCASVQEEADVAEELVLSATSEQLETMKSLADTEGNTEQTETAAEMKEDTQTATEIDIWEENGAEIKLQYIPETGYHKTIEGGGIKNSIVTWRLVSGYACWEDCLIIGENLYKKDNGTYKKAGDDYVEEMFQRNFCTDVRQYENFLITLYTSSHFDIFDMDTWEIVDTSDWDDILIYDSDNWYVFDGKIYYISDSFQSIHRIDMASGRDEVVYSLDETVFPCHMVYSFGIRDDGSIMAAIRSVDRYESGEPMYSLEAEFSLARRGEYHSQHIEFWMISPNEEGTAEQKVWETDVYSTVDSVDFNRQGFFFEGHFATWEERIEHEQEYGGIIWIKENGEMEQIISWSDYDNRRVGIYETIGGFYITEDGYYLYDNKIIIADPDGNEYKSYVDAVTKYDYEGNRIGGYPLLEKSEYLELLHEGWHLLELICYEDEFTAFYAKEDRDELYISQIQVE